MPRGLRLTGVGIGVVIVAMAIAWLTTRSAVKQPPPSTRGAQVVAGSLDDLLMDLQLVPLDGQTPRPFALESLDGKRVALADLAGKPALLYFWATW